MAAESFLKIVEYIDNQNTIEDKRLIFNHKIVIMTFEYFISGLTIVSSLAIKVIGYPAQIKAIHKNKSVEGVSLTLSILSVIAYICWTIHGIIHKDPVVFWGQALGVIMSIIVLLQVLYFRQRKNKNENKDL